MERTEFTYDGLCSMIEECLTPVSYEVFQQRRKLLVIAISEEVRFRKSVQKIEECNPNIELIIVAQMELKKVLDEIYNGRYQVVGWSGKYMVELVDKIKSEADISRTDGFLYFTQHPVNLRDKNMISIAKRLQKEADIRVYSDTVGYELYEYHNLSLYSQGIKVYEEINRFISLQFKNVTREGRA
ncbi:MAG: hypothetical protein K2O16_06025 [Lachnospiraceae bacterium]|nr:hypothetical protein [Lachnospiraceae bacterium]